MFRANRFLLQGVPHSLTVPATPTTPKLSHFTTAPSLFQRIVGRESLLKREVRRYIPTDGWTTTTAVMDVVPGNVRGVVTVDVLSELLRSLPDLHFCPDNPDRVCRKLWYDAKTTSDDDRANRMSSTKPKMISSEAELATAVEPYIPTHFAPLRAVQRMVPMDLAASLRLSKYVFITSFPEKFDVQYLVDDSAVVVRRKSTDVPDVMPNLYCEYVIAPELISRVALCLPCDKGLCEADALRRIPLNLRREVKTVGYTLSAMCAMYDGLFYVERERGDTDAFQVTLRSVVSDPEATADDAAVLKDGDVDVMFEDHKHRLLPLSQPGCVVSGGMVPVTASNFEEMMNKSAATNTKTLNKSNASMMLPKEKIIVAILQQLTAASVGGGEGWLDLDKMVLRLTPSVQRSLIAQEGGARGFVASNADVFEMKPMTPHGSRLPVLHIRKNPSYTPVEASPLKTPKGVAAADATATAAEGTTPALTPLQRATLRQLAQSVHQQLPQDGTGVALEELAQNVPKPTRKAIKALGYNLVTFIQAHSDVFEIDLSSEDRLVRAVASAGGDAAGGTDADDDDESGEWSDEEDGFGND